jgi:ribonucleoside-triphosphate reductase (thioredoxin)
LIFSEGFISRYESARDTFPNLLARSTYLSKYCRGGESWTGTVRRVVEANCALDPNVTEQEAKALFHAIWKGWALPPGRGLWTGGVLGMPVEARYNCWASVIRGIDDWCWTANMLMCGGGVGVSLLEIDKLAAVKPGNARLNILCSKSHTNAGEVMPDDPHGVAVQYIVEDTREGWVDALCLTLEYAFAGQPLSLNLSSIRPRGARIRTFGGVACGPGPLAQLCREVWAIIRGAAGRKLSSVECLDITNHIGVCIKSGNVRRSALIVLGRAGDQAFRDAKKSWDAVRSHRHSSNNSIVFETADEIDAFDWEALVQDNASFGEPGILNLWKIRQTDPGAIGVNPCGEIPLHNREACNLAEVFPALVPADERERVLQLITRYSLRQRLEPLKDKTAESVRIRNMRIGVGLGGICDFAWSSDELKDWSRVVRREAFAYATDLGVNIPVATTTVKPSGTISLLNGSSPGIHAPYAPYYLRRTRISRQEAMAEALIDAGVPFEECVYDSTGNTLVFIFPMKAREGTTSYVTTETAKSQIERQVAVQKHWADNAVSTTISFVDDEREELAALLRTHARELKSISCLPSRHGYAQPPYEEIDATRYSEMMSSIKLDHPLTEGGELDIQECAGGACPVR